MNASGDKQRVVRARIAVSACFFMFGLTFGLWAVHIPAVAERLRIDPAILGLALLNIGLGGVVSQLLSGWLVGRIGSRPVARILMPAFVAIALLPIAAWSVPVFFVATFLLGSGAGALNVAINTQASEVERARGRPTMSSFHGFFSLGALAGASSGGAVFALKMENGSGAAVVLAVLFALAVIATRTLLPSAPAVQAAARSGEKRFAMPGAAILGLAVLAFFANMVEGAVNDWSALYLTADRGLAPAIAVSGFAIFSLAMAICRLAGGPVVARLGDRNIVLYGGALMAAGMGVVVLSPWDVVSPFGFALVAIGAANTIPVMISAASRLPGTAPSAGVTAASTGALLGFVIGPPIIGFIAHAAGLGIALGCLSLVGVVIVIGAALYRWPAREAAAASI